MFYYEVSMIGNVGKFREVLTYASSTEFTVGTLVSVPVGKKTSTAVVIREVDKPDFDCKEIAKAIMPTPLPESLIKLHDWMSTYYATSSGAVWQTFLPARLAVKPRKPLAITDEDKAVRTNIVFNKDQASAIAKIRETKSGSMILHGITGSGKTAVYKQIATDTINAGRSVIVLVPEISLTTQLVQEFQRDFKRVIVTHSAMTAAERNATWRAVLTADKPVVIVGPRSALFLPVRNLGLIIVDEFHEPSYRQETSPRYNATTVAAKLAQLTSSRLLLGSATPSIGDYYLASLRHRPIIQMTHLAKPGAVRPTTKIIDLTKRDNFSLESHLFTKPLLAASRQALKDHRQVLYFHNRRGTAGLAMCENCGWIATCPNCFIPLTLHGDKFQLVCHLCGYTEKPPLSCPDCHEPKVVYKGIGTKRIEEEAKKLFPKATIRRFDGDTVKGEAVQDLYDELKDGTVDIIIGTQTIAKGLDLPKLAVAGIIQADAGLAMPDFSASERTFQLIAQASGRVGRGSEATTAIIQSYRPDDPAVKFGALQDYASFYKAEITKRQQGHFPPFAHLLKLTCTYKTERGATSASGRLTSQLRQRYGNQIKLLGPAPSFYERLRGLYRWQIVIRASKRSILTAIATDVAKLPAWQIELDPGSLL